MVDNLNPIKDHFLKKGKLLSFNIGQNLCSGNIFLVKLFDKTGKARLISKVRGNLTTLKNLDRDALLEWHHFSTENLAKK